MFLEEGQPGTRTSFTGGSSYFTEWLRAPSPELLMCVCRGGGSAGILTTDTQRHSNRFTEYCFKLLCMLYDVCFGKRDSQALEHLSLVAPHILRSGYVPLPQNSLCVFVGGGGGSAGILTTDTQRHSNRFTEYCFKLIFVCFMTYVLGKGTARHSNIFHWWRLIFYGVATCPFPRTPYVRNHA